MAFSFLIILLLMALLKTSVFLKASVALLLLMFTRLFPWQPWMSESRGLDWPTSTRQNFSSQWHGAEDMHILWRGNFWLSRMWTEAITFTIWPMPAQHDLRLSWTLHFPPWTPKLDFYATGACSPCFSLSATLNRVWANSRLSRNSVLHQFFSSCPIVCPNNNFRTELI